MFPITYGNAWKDQLTSYNGQVIEYDVLGNPTTYRGNNLTWTKVSKLASFGNNTFKYNASGIRFKKNNTVYTLEGNKILKEIDGSKTLTYYYGVNGVVGFNYNKKDYFYCKNLQGDIVSIYRADGTKVAEYAYNAWGKVLAVNNYTAENIGTINPIRYRGYYYDTETNLYYLETRYYDPETGRFISADNTKYLESKRISGLNLYEYCLNNPIDRSDYSGCRSTESIGSKLLRLILSPLKAIKANIGGGIGIGAEASLVLGGVDVSLGASSSCTDSISVENLQTDLKNESSFEAKAGILNWEESYIAGKEHSYFDEACTCDMWKDSFAKKSNCPANKKIEKQHSSEIGVTLGGYIIIGGEISLSFDVDAFVEELIDIFTS